MIWFHKRNVNWTEMERVHELNKFTFLKKQWMWPELNSFFQIWMWSEFYSSKKGTYNALVRTPRTQPGNVGKFSVFWCFCYVNNQIKTTTENLPTQPCCVPGVRTDSPSKFVAFVENGTKLRLTTPSMLCNDIDLSWPRCHDWSIVVNSSTKGVKISVMYWHPLLCGFAQAQFQLQRDELCLLSQ